MFANVVERVDKKEEIRTNVLKRLGKQIANYKTQIDKLLESKDNMESYYQNEIKNLKDTTEFLTKENEELKTQSQTIENESVENQKLNVLCNQEYSSFKEAFKIILEIAGQIPEFDKSSADVKNTRNKLLSDELLKTKENIKLKNKEIRARKCH